jgi:hypothetical protein
MSWIINGGGSDIRSWLCGGIRHRFYRQEGQQFIMTMKNNKSTGCGSVSTEIWIVLGIKTDEIGILTGLFIKIKIPSEWKATVIFPTYS